MLLSKSRRVLVSPKSERRSWHRLPVQLGVFCQKARGKDELWWSASVMDISRGGMKLFSPHSFAPSTLIRISEADEAEKLAALEATVVRAQLLPGAKWTLGCALTKELSQEELLTWFGSLGWL